MAVLADERAVEEVAGIDLHPRLGGPQLQHASRFRVLQPGGEFGLAGDALVEHEIMVISAAGDDLRSEERRGGTECGSTCRTWWSQDHQKKKSNERQERPA